MMFVRDVGGGHALCEIKKHHRVKQGILFLFVKHFEQK